MKWLAILLSFFISSCSGQNNDRLCLNRQNICAQYGSCNFINEYLYYVYPTDGRMELKCCSASGKEITVIDEGWYLGHIQISENDIYYIKYNDFGKSGMIIKSSVDGKEKSVIKLLSNEFNDGRDYIYLDSQNNIFYFSENDACLYDIYNDVVVIGNIKKPLQFEDKLYYSDIQNNICEYSMDTHSNKIFISQQDIAKQIIQMYDIEDEYIIHSIARDGTKLYFLCSTIIEYDRYRCGYLFSYDISNKIVSPIIENKMCYQYQVCNNNLYIIANDNKRKFYKYSDSKLTEIEFDDITVSTITSFYIFNNNLYLNGIIENVSEDILNIYNYLVVASDQGKIKYWMEDDRKSPK